MDSESKDKRIKSYSEFWPYYLREHSQPLTRAFHYFGTSLGISLVIFSVLTKQWNYLWFAMVSGYFFAWLSHFFIEKNKPATFKYPLWSFISDFKMLFYFLSGRLK